MSKEGEPLITNYDPRLVTMWGSKNYDEIIAAQRSLLEEMNIYVINAGVLELDRLFGYPHHKDQTPNE